MNKIITSTFKEVKNISNNLLISFKKKINDNNFLFSKEKHNKYDLLTKKRERGNKINKPLPISEKTKDIISKVLKKQKNFLCPIHKNIVNLKIDKHIFNFSKEGNNNSNNNNKKNNNNNKNNSENKNNNTNSNNNSNNNNNNNNNNLSSYALDIVKKVQKKKNNLKPINNNNNNNSKKINKNIFSNLKIKYESLLKENRELPLSYKFNLLFINFSHFEDTINNIKILKKKNNLFFSKIKSNIELTYKTQFILDTLKKILYLVPNFYIIKYKINKDEINNDNFKDNESNNNLNNKYNFYDLYIDFNKKYKENITDYNPFSINNEFNCSDCSLDCNTMKERKKIFKYILYEIINEEHKKFLSENNIKYFDAFKFKTWHHDFNLDNIKDIPLYEIPEQPLYINNMSYYENMIKENDLKSFLIKNSNLLNECENKNNNNKNNNNKNNSEDNNESSYDIDINNNNNNVNDEEDNSSYFVDINDNNNNIISDSSGVITKYVSYEFYEKLKSKEKAIKVSNEILNYNLKNHMKKKIIENIKELILSIKTLFISLKTESENFNNFCEMLFKSNINEYSIEEIKINIKKICKKFSNFLKIINHSTLGKLLVVDNTVDINEIIKEIKEDDFI